MENTGENNVLHSTVLGWLLTAFFGFLILVPTKSRNKFRTHSIKRRNIESKDSKSLHGHSFISSWFCFVFEPFSGTAD